MSQSVMPVLRRALVPEVLPAVMPDLPAVPEVLPAPLPEPALPARLPADLPAEGRAALAAALNGALPGGQRPDRGGLVRGAGPFRWEDAEITRLLGFLRTVEDRRGRRGRAYPLEYLLAIPLAAGMAGDGELDAAAEWAATAPAELLLKLGAPLDRAGEPRRPDATTLGRTLADGADQEQYDDALCAWTAARARALRPGMRRHLRIDGKAVRGAAHRGGRAPMLLSGIWDDGTTAAQLPVDVKKTNEIPVFRDLLGKIPAADLKDAVITADQMHTQRKHARKIRAADAHFIFTIGENQKKLFDAADALPWESFAGEAWTVDRGHGRIDVRTIKTLPPTGLIRKLFPHVAQVFLAERYSYGPDGELPGAVAVLGITSLPASQAGAADLLAYLRGHWSIEMHHYVRDVVFGEDSSRIRGAHRAMAAVRNTVTGILHLHQVPNIAAQLRACRRDPYRLPLLLLGLVTPLAPNGNPAVT
jgi:predicted transposase YbfD/YdcC